MSDEQSTATAETTEATAESTPAEVTAPETKPEDNLGDAGKAALSAERDARKAAEKQIKELEAKLAKQVKAPDTGPDLDAIREELRGEFASQLAETALRGEAKGRMVNPADVTLFLSPADYAGKGEDAVAEAVTKLLEERPYLAAQTETKPHWGDVGGGRRDQSEPEPKSALDRMVRAYSSAK